MYNGRGQLNLLPLITRIAQDPEKKTHPISSDKAVTSCGPVSVDAVPVGLLMRRFVRARTHAFDRVQRLVGCFAASSDKSITETGPR